MAIAKKPRLFAALFMAIASPLTLSASQADMGLAPLRQVLSEEHREAAFTVSNPSDRIMDATVSWTDLAATETGYAPAAPELRAELSAAPWLFVSPAHFRLKPGARQLVTVRVKDGAALPDGERRSHLLIETQASRSAIRKASAGLQVDVSLGLSAPVLLRHGGGKAKAKIANVRLLRDDDGLLMLETAIEPTGDWSSFGRLVVTYTPEGGEKELLGLRENVAGFTDAALRKVTIPFGYVSLSAGELVVRYEGAAEFSGVVFDERAFDIAPPEDG
ncbi:fimbrial biogenesis chaperone [Hyphococcus sp.]|uniref:fimbrial biogenesis chaperone n=1 Tax=Hyphococcus sp. TaxID=2038636 RepID=UPI0035C74F46